jgi:hypothetical protein
MALPVKDIKLFIDKLGTDGIFYIAQEDITPRDGSGWQYQQVVKSCFWKQDLAESYLCVDSDQYFITDFYRRNFFYESTPLTVIHDEIELISFFSRHPNNEQEFEDYISGRHRIRKLVGRRNTKLYNFGPPPFLFTSRVWRAFENEVVPRFNMESLDEFIMKYGDELIWYGEAVLHTRAIPLYPTGPFFLVFDYKKQYEDYKTRGITADMIARQYMGIGIQSAWKGPLKY